MQIDASDDKHKVYIYNLDDELSSESETEDGKLVLSVGHRQIPSIKTAR